jgi:hypothetical protein
MTLRDDGERPKTDVKGILKSDPKRPKGPREPLSEWAGRLRGMMDDGALGPLRAAEPICAVLAPNWNSYKAEAGGMRCTSWLISVLGKGHGLGYFQPRYKAVKLLGEDARRWIHHDLAKWVVKQTQDREQLRKIKVEWRTAWRANGKNPLSIMQGTRIARELLGKTPRKRDTALEDAKQRIAQLEHELVQHGIPVPPWK